MKIYLKRTVDIDLDSEINRVDQHDFYTTGEKDRLLEIYSKFKEGLFQEALDLINKLPNTPAGYSEKEHIMTEVSDFYMDFNYFDIEVLGFEK